jgi:hypothetical protein
VRNALIASVFAISLMPTVFLAGCGGEGGEKATLKINDLLKAPPAPRDASLSLIASGVEACVGGDHEVADVTVDESDTEVVIDAEIRTDDQPLCELRTAQEEFTVDLDGPLGQRVVIDDSRGQRLVIWSPEKRRDILRRLRINSADAEAFIRVEYPAADHTRCVDHAPDRFYCTVAAAAGKKPVVIYVEVRAGGELKAFPEAPPLPPELRTG